MVIHKFITPDSYDEVLELVNIQNVQFADRLVALTGATGTILRNGSRDCGERFTRASRDSRR